MHISIIIKPKFIQNPNLVDSQVFFGVVHKVKMEDSKMFLPNHNTAHFHDSWKITGTNLETVMMNKKLLFHQGLNRVLHYKHCSKVIVWHISMDDGFIQQHFSFRVVSQFATFAKILLCNCRPSVLNESSCKHIDSGYQVGLRYAFQTSSKS